MVKKQNKLIPLKEGFWVFDELSKKPRLIGSKCDSCDEVYFPKKETSWCVHCQTNSLKEIFLSRQGRVVTFSVVMQQPAGGFYKGPVPFSYGQVDLPEGVRLTTLFSLDDFSELGVGESCELVIEKLYEDEEENEIVTFKFRPKKET